MSAVIETIDLSFRYPGAEDYTLRNVNLTIEQGDFVAVVGGNGSGKTTLCKTFNGLIPHYWSGDFAGEVLDIHGYTGNLQVEPTGPPQGENYEHDLLMPYSYAAALRIEEPSDLRDTVWTAGNLTLQNGGEFVVLIPTRYPGTPVEGDNAAKLARTTTWVDLGGDAFRGVGQRILTTDQGDTPLMDLRVLHMGAGDG